MLKQLPKIVPPPPPKAIVVALAFVERILETQRNAKSLE
jgi:hypothetical protein